ncbi:MAG: CHAD domain-containing protein [Pelovirga sp.]
MPFNFELKNADLFNDLQPLAGMQIREERAECRQLSVLDSVDWSIWLSGRVLIEIGSQRLELITDNDTCQASAEVTRIPLLARELPDPLRSELKKLISVRALISQFSCQWQERALVFLNTDEKIVVRATIYDINNSSTAGPAFLTLHPLRGYDQEARAIVKSLDPLVTATPIELSLRFLLERCGLTPSPLKARPEFHLEAHQPTEEAVLVMVAELLRLARQQEEGLIADIDTEFTHQYRVNLRKARSLLSLFKKELSPQRYRVVQAPLKNMAKATNRLRDLDVFLLDQDDYRAMLPAHFQPGLDELFKRLKRRRRQVWREVTATLKKEDYLETAQQLEQRLKEPPDLSAPHSASAIKKRVSRKILSQYYKIQQHGARIDPATSDEQVHELRIEAKKLRYLLELFAELFSYDQVRRLVKALKKLQDNLGRFNDYSSQCLFLESLLRGTGIKTAERDAVSGLIAVLYSKQKNEREQVVGMIADFSGTEIAEQFQQLFAPAATKDGRS